MKLKPDELAKLSDLIIAEYGNKRNIIKAYGQKLTFKKLNLLIDEYEDLAEAFKIAKESKRSFVQAQELHKISEGDSRVLVEAMKESYRQDVNTKELVAIEIYKRSDSFNDFASGYTAIFGGNTQACRKLIDDCLVRYGVESIKARKKRLNEEYEKSLSRKLELGEVSQKEFLKAQLVKVTAISETGSESNRVQAVRAITQVNEQMLKLHELEIQENKRPKSAQEVILAIDCALFDASPEMIEELKAKVNSEEEPQEARAFLTHQES